MEGVGLTRFCQQNNMMLKAKSGRMSEILENSCWRTGAFFVMHGKDQDTLIDEQLMLLGKSTKRPRYPCTKTGAFIEILKLVHLEINCQFIFTKSTTFEKLWYFSSMPQWWKRLIFKTHKGFSTIKWIFRWIMNFNEKCNRWDNSMHVEIMIWAGVIS